MSQAIWVTGKLNRGNPEINQASTYNYEDEDCSSRDSFTAFKSLGINFWFVTMIPTWRSRYFPFEKSNGFPAASETTPPASTISSLTCQFYHKNRLWLKNSIAITVDMDYYIFTYTGDIKQYHRNEKQVCFVKFVKTKIQHAHWPSSLPDNYMKMH